MTVTAQHVGQHRVVRLTEGAHAINSEPFTTAKGTLRRYRHAIQAVVNGETHDTYSVNRPVSPQARIKRMLKGRPGLTFDQQAENFKACIDLTTRANAKNIKAQSARVIAEKALHIIDARRAEKDRAATVAATPVNPDSWDDDDLDDDEDDSDW